MNPTDEFTKAVEEALKHHNDIDSFDGEYREGGLSTFEALASIQASTVKLLEGLKKKQYYATDVGYDHGDVVDVSEIDQLIKDLSNE